MNKHTPLTKPTKNEGKQNPHRKKDNIQRIKIENIKKSKAPLIPTQKNKFHYNIERNVTRKFLASTWLNKQRRIEETLTTFL